MHKRHPKTETSTPAKLLSESELGVRSGVSELDQIGNAKSQASVRVRAYQKWDAAGKPDGDGINFWLEAEQEVLHPQARTTTA